MLLGEKALIKLFWFVLKLGREEALHLLLDAHQLVEGKGSQYAS